MWSERDVDDRGFTERRRRFVCVICQRIILLKEQVVRRDRQMLCSQCASEERASAS